MLIPDDGQKAETCSKFIAQDFSRQIIVLTGSNNTNIVAMLMISPCCVSMSNSILFSFAMQYMSYEREVGH